MGDKIVLCGCMGSGKSTVGQMLADALGWHYQPEPYMQNKYLQDFIANKPEAVNFAALAQAQQTILCAESLLQSPGCVVLDAALSPWAFTYVAFLEGRITLPVFEAIQNLAETLLFAEFSKQKAIGIVLKAQPEIIQERVLGRGRAFETNVTHDFIAKLCLAMDLLAEKAGMHVVNADGTPAEVLADIMTIVNNKR